MITLPLLLYRLEVQGREAQVLGSGLGSAVQLRWEDPLVRPLEETSVRRRRMSVVILASHVQGQVEEVLTAGFDEGGEAEIATMLADTYS